MYPMMPRDGHAETVICPREIAPEARLLFWFLVILLPFFVLRFAFREIVRREEATNLQLVKRELMNEAEDAANRLRLERGLAESLQTIERRVGFPPFGQENRFRFSRNTPLVFDAGTLAESLWQGIGHTLGTAPLFLFTLGPDGRESEIRTNPAYVSSREQFSRRSVRNWLHALARTPGRSLWEPEKGIPDDRRRWEGNAGIERLRAEVTRFVKYYFGMYALPYGVSGQPRSFFTHRFGGGKLVLYHRFITASERPDAPVLGGYLVGVLDRAVPPGRLTAQAARLGTPDRFGYLFGRGKAVRGPVFTKSRRGITLWNPLSRDPGLRVKGMTPGFDSPYLGVRAGWEQIRHPARRFFSLVDCLLAAGGILALWLILFGDRWAFVRNMDVRGKLLFALGLAMAFPLLAFWTAASAYFSFHQRLEIKRELISMTEQLARLENGLKSYSLSHRTRFLKWRKLFGKSDAWPISKVSQCLDGMLTENELDTVQYVRRDGQSLIRTASHERGPWDETRIERIIADPFNAMAWALLRFTFSISPETEEAVKKNGNMISAMAFADAFHFRELNGILLQDFKPLEISLFGDRAAQYSLEIVTDADAVCPTPIAVLFARETYISMAESYMRGFANPLGNLDDGRSSFQVRAGLFSIPHLQGAGEGEATSCVWPEGARRDALLRSIARRAIDSGSEGTWDTRENGLPMLFAVRKFSPLPFIAVAGGHWRSDIAWWQTESGWALLLAVYSAGILFLQGMVLAGTFVRPLRILTEAASRVEKGELGIDVALETKDEFAMLGHEFNLMTRGLRERQRLTRFVSDEALRSVCRDQAAMREAGGLRVRRTVLFVHIRGFASLAEAQPPEAVVALLNRYFDVMEGVISARRGTIDKYISDAIMAVFAPLENAVPPEVRAAGTALEMRRELATLNREWAATGTFQIEIGIGIATGEMISGYIGSDDGRQSLTVIGDTVNLAARLESRSELAGLTGIAICAVTAQACRGACVVQPLGTIPIKGKDQPVSLFELVSEVGV